MRSPVRSSDAAGCSAPCRTGTRPGTPSTAANRVITSGLAERGELPPPPCHRPPPPCPVGPRPPAHHVAAPQRVGPLLGHWDAEMHLHGLGGGPGTALGTRPVAAENPDSAIGEGAGPVAAAARCSALSPAALGAVGWPRGPGRGRAPAAPSPLVSAGGAGLLVAAPLRLRHSGPGKGGR